MGPEKRTLGGNQTQLCPGERNGDYRGNRRSQGGPQRKVIQHSWTQREYSPKNKGGSHPWEIRSVAGTSGQSESQSEYGRDVLKGDKSRPQTETLVGRSNSRGGLSATMRLLYISV